MSSDYEVLRLKRIEENQALLRSLQIPTLSKPDVDPISITDKKKARPKRKREDGDTENEPPEPTVRRVSSRLRAIDPDSEAAKEIARIKEEEEAKERERKSRVPGPVHIDTDVTDDAQKFSTIFASFTSTKSTSPPRTANADPSKLTVCVPDAVRFSKERIYSMAAYTKLCGSTVGSFWGDKQGNIGFVGIDMDKARDVKEREGSDYYEDEFSTVKVWEVHRHRPVTSLVWRGDRLWTSSYEGSVRSFDPAHPVFQDHVGDDAYEITTLSMHAGTKFGMFGDTEGMVFRFDPREPSGAKLAAYELHTRKVSCVSLNPAKEHLMATSSLDGSCKVWDTRALKKSGGAALAATQHGKSCTSAYWSEDGERVVTTSYDDTIRILRFWDPMFTQLASISHNNNTGRWVTCFRAQFGGGSASPYVTAGNMSRGVDVYNGKTGAHIAMLSDPAVVSAIPAVNCMVGGEDGGPVAIVAGNASGKVVAWC
ncbi:WD40 repeat-like protein [Gonapodya prolifera JEL478]|uniref:DNA damage-binding protein CMR1 n=1 Tax=Gonapodya prolifera (strain JEL478) TaxID=1344416 RepID=A0A138ZXV7_GONPJ|nr:WD40 repeat-like protein [Gonapodya prolifera JEL478]|eukprot:KXS09342.1 WD40 repeat-like protein [Gonapodya prolifera JEL478]